MSAEVLRRSTGMQRGGPAPERRLRILVYPHELEMGGSQINAVELAASIRDLGHDVFVFATMGVLVDKVKELGIPYIEAPRRRFAVDPATLYKLRTTVRRLGIDIVHPYEWTAILDTAYGPCLGRTKAVMTVLSMDVPDFLPRHIPLIVGTHGLADIEARRRGNIHVMEPPIDTELNKSRGAAAARRELGVGHGAFVVSVVGRLTTDLGKLDGVLSAISVIDRLAAHQDLVFLVAGDGPGIGEVRDRADRVNRCHRRKVIRVLGNVLNPGPVYDAADIVLGMGSSALRGMSYAKPLIVQGQAGFWQLSSPETVSQFLNEGWFGSVGGGEVDLEKQLSSLLADSSRRSQLGTFGRALVEERFSLRRAAERLLSLYRAQLSVPFNTFLHTESLARTAFETAKFRLAVSGQPRARGAYTKSGGL